MNNSNIDPNKTLTLDNGAGTVTLHVGDWVVNGWDIQHNGNVFSQFRKLSDTKFNAVQSAFDKGGSDAAWATLHNLDGASNG